MWLLWTRKLNKCWFCLGLLLLWLLLLTLLFIGFLPSKFSYSFFFESLTSFVLYECDSGLLYFECKEDLLIFFLFNWFSLFSILLLLTLLILIVLKLFFFDLGDIVSFNLLLLLCLIVLKFNLSWLILLIFFLSSISLL